MKFGSSPLLEKLRMKQWNFGVSKNGIMMPAEKDVPDVIVSLIMFNPRVN
jgi:hypothetical protein